MLDRLLDRSIVFDFDRTGFRRHAKRFSDDPERDLAGRTVLLTGGTKGIGLAAAESLGRRGAHLHLWARDPEAGAEAERVVRQAGGEATFRSVDLGDLEAVAEAAQALPEAPAALLLNAGAMPLERRLTPQSHELIWASQVLAHALVLRVLRQRRALADDTRVVWVSSGGMYGARLDLSDLRRDRGYQRHGVYANAKRAQVVLARRLARRWPDLWQGSMHPGWVATGAVKHAMPVFHALTKPILREPAEGADTIVWLAAVDTPLETGRFWFDREQRPEHLRDGTRVDDAREAALLERVWADTEPFLRPASG